MMKDTTRFSGINMGLTLQSRGIRLDWFALQVGVSGATVTRWAKGDRTMSRKHAERAADVLNVPFFLLFELPLGDDQSPDRKDVA